MRRHTHTTDTAPPREPNALREKIASDVEAYLARGGQITVLPTNAAVNPQLTFEITNAKDQLREEHGGRWWLGTARVSLATKIPRPQLNQMIASGEFPRPTKRGRRDWWPEEEVMQWIAERAK